MMGPAVWGLWNHLELCEPAKGTSFTASGVSKYLDGIGVMGVCLYVRVCVCAFV